jgi:hypothetical protein
MLYLEVLKGSAILRVYRDECARVCSNYTYVSKADGYIDIYYR